MLWTSWLILGLVYTDAVSFVNASFSMRLRLPFTWRRSRPLLKPSHFENAVKSGAFWKRYGFLYRVNGETASIWKRSLISCTKMINISLQFSFHIIQNQVFCCAHVTNQKRQLRQYSNNYFFSILTLFCPVFQFIHSHASKILSRIVCCRFQMSPKVKIHLLWEYGKRKFSNGV